jgi:hypothetical protein
MAPVNISILLDPPAWATLSSWISIGITLISLGIIAMLAKRKRSREELLPIMRQKKAKTVVNILELQPSDPIHQADRELLNQILGASAGRSQRVSSLMTSGYLAAKVKLAKLTTTDIASPVIANGNHVIPVSTLAWSRSSSPGPRWQGKHDEVLEDQEPIAQLTKVYSLRMAAKHEESIHFSDDYHPKVKWRRRTMIFEKTS